MNRIHVFLAAVLSILFVGCSNREIVIENRAVVSIAPLKPIVENIVQEASIVEEVPDYGIMKDEDGNIIITRAFGPKTKYKYSFRDFGVIDKVSFK